LLDAPFDNYTSKFSRDFLDYYSTTFLGILVGLFRWTEPSVWKLRMKKCLGPILKIWKYSQVDSSFIIWMLVVPSFLK
jgi:hypothetical protein